MSLSLSVSRKFNANYSLLGRLIRRSVTDVHYAEGILILAIALITIVLVVGFYLAWAFVQPAVESDATGNTALLYFFSQSGVFLLFFMLTILGFKPGVHVSLKDHCLHIKHGPKKLLLLVSEIESIESISALQFHQHYRKYENTRAFFNKLPDHLLLLHTHRGPVILGISEQDQATLLEAIRSSATTQSERSLAYVA